MRERSSAILPGIAPSNVYPASDGDYLIGANQDGVFARLCAAMGRPELAHDPAYASHEARGQHQLDDLIGAWTATLTTAELEAILVAAGVPAGRVYRPQDMLDDPHFQARAAITKVPHPHLGTVTMQNVMPRLSATPGAIRRHAPETVGQDNDDVYGTMLGLDASALADLRQRGII